MPRSARVTYGAQVAGSPESEISFPALRQARILVIRQGYFPLDPRVRREVSALESAGCEIDVICMRGPGEASLERSGGVTIRRFGIGKPSGRAAAYLYGYLQFLAMAGATAAMLHARRRYSLVQVNTMPDELVFSALLPKLVGVPILLDLHETMPEFLATKFRRTLDDRMVRMVGRLEQLSIRFASFSVTCTEQMKEAFVARGADSSRIGVVLNSSNEEIFDPVRYPPRPRERGRFKLICHGTIEDRYGIDTAIRAVALLRKDIPEIELDVVGDGGHLPVVTALAWELAVEDRVHFSNGFVPMPDLLSAIADADLGVVAMKRDSFRDLTHCNKMFDFISLCKPAVVSRTNSVEAYFGPDCFQLFESDNPADMARGVLEVYRDPALGARLAQCASATSEPYVWARQRDLYLGFVSPLIEGRRPEPGPRLDQCGQGRKVAMAGSER